MNYSNKYSICYHPSNELIEDVKQIKLELANHIGWYNSKNSLAHITIAEFVANDREIAIIHKQLLRLTQAFSPVDIYLNAFNSFPNGALFLEVEADVQQALNKYNKQILQTCTLNSPYISNSPHLSIARKLDSERLQKAIEVLAKPNLYFSCNQIALRRLNLDRKQFDIIQTYPFLGNAATEPEQLSLF